MPAESESEMAMPYLSNLRPDFRPYEIDCGKIHAYRYAGGLRSELETGRLDAAAARMNFSPLSRYFWHIDRRYQK